jgi:hypothetical protein
MESLKQYIERNVRENGYAIIKMSRYKSSKYRLGNCATGPAVMRLGYTYTDTGGYMGIAPTQLGARAACYYAIHRGAIKRYDAATDYQREIMLRRSCY